MFKIDTPWDRAKQRRSIKQERENAARPGGSKQIASGRFWFSKRDTKFHGFLEENRTTDAASYTIQVHELKKLTQDAFFENCLPSMPIEFNKWGERWVLVRHSDLDQIRTELLWLQDHLREMEET